MKAYFSQPSASFMRDIYVSPFSPELWGILTLTWVLAIVLLGPMTWVLAHKVHMQSSKPEWFSKDSFIWAVGTACQQGTSYIASLAAIVH